MSELLLLLVLHVLSFLLSRALKVIAARDEKKSLICWSISYDKSATLPVADRLLCEIRTFEIVNHLVASEWELGPDGADRAEVLLYKHA